MNGLNNAEVPLNSQKKQTNTFENYRMFVLEMPGSIKMLVTPSFAG